MKRVPPPAEPRPEPSRARYPDEEGYVERDGQQLFYEVYGEGDPTVLFMAPWVLVHSRAWKMQIPYFARRYRVVTFDGLGNGKSDRPRDPARYGYREYAKDALAVLDATETDRAVVVGGSAGFQAALALAADHPGRVLGLAGVSVFLPLTLRSQLLWRPGPWFLLSRPGRWLDKRLGGHLRRISPIGGWHPDAITADYRGFTEWWMSALLPEPHSNRSLESTVEWALETDAETVACAVYAPLIFGAKPARELMRRVRCPVIAIHGDRDRFFPHGDGKALAKETGGRLVTVHGGGHEPAGREPVPVNLALRDFIESVADRATADVAQRAAAARVGALDT